MAVEGYTVPWGTEPPVPSLISDLPSGTCGSGLGNITCGSGRALRSCFWPETSSPILGSIRISLPMTTTMTSC